MKRKSHRVLGFILSCPAFIILDINMNKLNIATLIFYILLVSSASIFLHNKLQSKIKTSYLITAVITGLLITIAKTALFYTHNIGFAQSVESGKALLIILCIILTMPCFYFTSIFIGGLISLFCVPQKCIAPTCKKLNRLSIVIIALSLIMFIFLSIDIFRENYMSLYKSHDIRFHVNRIVCISAEFKNNGIFTLPLRIYSSCLNGYGYANPMFYGDIFLYVPALLIVYGIEAITAYKIFIILIFAAAFLSMLVFTNKLSQNINQAVAAAFLYAFSSYFATDLITRAALGESLAFIFLPAAFYAWHSICYTQQKCWITLSLSMCALILSHIITSVIFSLILLVSFLAHFKKNKKIICPLLKATLLTTGLISFFIFPMLEQFASQKFIVTSRYDNLIDRVPGILYSVFPSNLTHYILYKSEHWSPGFWALLPIFLCIILKKLSPCRLSSYSKEHSWILLFTAIFSATPVCFLFNRIFQFIQFPWRVMVFIILSASFICAEVLTAYKRKRYIIPALLIAVLTFSVTIYDSGLPARLGIGEEADFSSWRIGAGEYLPISRAKTDDPYFSIVNYMKERGYSSAADNPQTHTEVTRKNKTIICRFWGNTSKNLTIELPLTYYKGYHAEINGRECRIDKNYFGLAALTINNAPQNGEIKIFYKKTDIQRISDFITFITLILLVFILLKKFFRRDTYEKTYNAHNSMLQ